MKKLLIIIGLIVAFGLWGEVEIIAEENLITIKGSFEVKAVNEVTIDETEYSEVIIEGCSSGGLPGELRVPHYSRLLALPDNGNWQIKDFSYQTEEIRLEKPLVHRGAEENARIAVTGWYPQQLVQIGEPVIMRQVRMAQVSINAMQYKPAGSIIRLLKSFELHLELAAGGDINARMSTGAREGSSFSRLAAANAAGYGNCRNGSNGAYLFICPDNPSVVGVLNYLVEWKQKLGHAAQIATLTETGDTNDEIKNYLQNAYDNWENKPEYVVLVGDVTGNIIVPSWYITGYLEPYCVTDHPYALLEGDDYFPDVMIGRLSVQTINQLQTIVNKIINYEQNPVMSSDWIRRALMLSYVMDYGGSYQMYSQRETVMAVREKLLDFTYAEVDTFISPWQTGITNLTNYINTGYSFINYRGAGSPVYWSGGYDHMYTLWEIENLSNGFMLPMVTSIVCGGGDFAYSNYATSFGEQWLAAGSTSNPKGAIGFIGPSEYDTKTPFNNCNDMGIYQGITQEATFGSAEMMLRGKLELYNNYPGCHSMDGVNDAWDSDMFYFYVYNLLGDPGLQIWTDTPQEYSISLPDSIALGCTMLEVQLENMAEAGHIVSVTYQSGLYANAMTDENGWAAVAIPQESGEIQVTVSSYGFIPTTQTVNIVENLPVIGISSQELYGTAEPDEIIELVLQLENLTGVDQSGLNLELISYDEQVSVVNSEQVVNELLSGGSVEISFALQTDEEWRTDAVSRLQLTINDGELGSHAIFIEINSPELQYAGRTVLNEENCLLIGEENDLTLNIYNAGSSASGEFIAILASLDDKCQITQGDCAYGDTAPGETEMGMGCFSLIPAANLIAGEPAQFSLIIVKNGQIVWQTEFTMAVGLISPTSPSFSDYGYYAIESSDSGNFSAPDYEWLELKPELGGAGVMVPESHVTSDGFSTCIPLPFEFCYYGYFYNEITVSSSGWLAMGDEEFVFFRNRFIPSGVGASAMIAPFWDYLQDGEIYTYYNAYDNCFYIEWYGFHDDFQHQNQTFQVILYDPQFYPTATGDGEFKFQYHEVHNVDQAEQYATIGIENPAQTEGLLLSFANIYPETMHEIESGRAILFTIKEGLDVPRLYSDMAEIHLALEPDTIAEIELGLHNQSGQMSLRYEALVSHFPQRNQAVPGERDISGNSLNLITSTYFTCYQLDIYAFMVHTPIDGEAVFGVQLELPESVYTVSATDIGSLGYNGESGHGVTMSWGYGNGEPYNDNLPQAFHLYLEIDEGTSSPIPINWRIDGDGTGAEPHSLSGVVTLMPSAEKYIWVEYPNGGEQLAYGITDTIRWSSYGDIAEVDIFYTENNFVNYDIVGENIANTGQLEWSVPWELTETGMIRVRESAGNEYDNSDGFFAIKGLVITYPDNSTVLEYGSSAEVCWDFAGGTSSVDIDFSVTGGYNWETLADNVPNTGSYEFLVDIPPTEHGKIRIITYGQEMIISEMNGEFSIIDTPVDWLQIPESSGEIEPAGNTTLLLDINTEGMIAGQYLAYITIITEYNQQLSIPVFLEIPNLADDENEITASVLKGNYPNPFMAGNRRSAGTDIEFILAAESRVQLSIYNLRGQEVCELIDEKRGAGNYRFHWNGKNQDGLPIAAGVYFYQLMVDNKMVAINKCLLLK